MCKQMNKTMKGGQGGNKRPKSVEKTRRPTTTASRQKAPVSILSHLFKIQFRKKGTCWRRFDSIFIFKFFFQIKKAKSAPKQVAPRAKKSASKQRSTPKSTNRKKTGGKRRRKRKKTLGQKKGVKKQAGTKKKRKRKRRKRRKRRGTAEGVQQLQGQTTECFDQQQLYQQEIYLFLVNYLVIKTPKTTQISMIVSRKSVICQWQKE